MVAPSKPRVVIVDDSAVMRKLLEAGLSQSGRFDVVGTARDPYEAWELIKTLAPDAITLDVQMPRMDGLVFLERLMHQRPLPVVMVSALTQNGCEATLRALELGAVDFVGKPPIGSVDGTAILLSEIVAKLQRAVSTQVNPKLATEHGTGAAVGYARHARFIAIGGNSGGIDALRRILKALTASCSPVVVSHFLPNSMVQAMLIQMQRQSSAQIRLAQHGDELRSGTVLWAPFDKHLGLRKTIQGYAVELMGGDAINGCRPSVDHLFRSCVMLEERQFLAVLLDGVGVDGQSGLKHVEAHGALAILQRERPSAHEVQRLAESAVREQDRQGIQRLSANDIAAYLARVSAA